MARKITVEIEFPEGPIGDGWLVTKLIRFIAGAINEEDEKTNLKFRLLTDTNEKEIR